MIPPLSLLASPSSVPGLGWRILIAVAFTGAAAYYDLFNKKWVPNWLVYAFLACALAINLVFFEETLFIQAAVFAAVVFAASYLL